MKQQNKSVFKRNIVGFDFGDAESALTETTKDASDQPSKINTRFSAPNSGLIRSIVGYSADGQVFIGEEIESKIDEIDDKALYLSFKRVPTVGDKEYAKLVQDFINRLWKEQDEQGTKIEDTHIVIGHPTQWQYLNEGEPINVLKNILQETIIANHYELVPESRGAAIESLENTGNNSVNTFHQKGWALIIDMGSSTCDFTAVNISERTHEPIHHGDEVGARLIDRDILKFFTNKHKKSEKIEEHLRIPKNRVLFELASRNAKEKYFNVGSTKQTSHIFNIPSEDGDDIYLKLDLNDDVMNEILNHRKIVTYNGQAMSWRESFRTLMKHVGQAVEAKGGIDKIETIFLTGGASKMNFVKEDCLEAFPYLNADNILQDKSPQYSIASGLARWGRLQVRTHSFSEEIETFKENEMRQIIEDDYDLLMDAIATQLSTVAIHISKDEFKKWLDGETTYISTVESDIKSKVEYWVKYKFKDELDPIIKNWLKRILSTLTTRISQIEAKYNLPNTTLSKSFDLSLMDSTMLENKVNAGQLGDADEIAIVVADMFGNVIALVAGIVSYVVLPIILPTILTIIIWIVGLISVKLSALIFSILIAIPGPGWTLLIAIGAASLAVLIKGGSLEAVKESIADKVQDWDLPQWVRNSINFDKISTEIDIKRTSITEEISVALKNDKKMKEKVVTEIYDIYVIQLEQAVEDARLLIK